MTPRQTGPDKVQENRVRRVARRRGYTVTKSKIRDPYAIGFGTWTLLSPTGERLATGTLGDVERHLNPPKDTP